MTSSLEPTPQQRKGLLVLPQPNGHLRFLPIEAVIAVDIKVRLLPGDASPFVWYVQVWTAHQPTCWHLHNEAGDSPIMEDVLRQLEAAGLIVHGQYGIAAQQPPSVESHA